MAVTGYDMSRSFSRKSNCVAVTGQIYVMAMTVYIYLPKVVSPQIRVILNEITVFKSIIPYNNILGWKSI